MPPFEDGMQVMTYLGSVEERTFSGHPQHGQVARSHRTLHTCQDFQRIRAERIAQAGEFRFLRGTQVP